MQTLQEENTQNWQLLEVAWLLALHEASQPGQEARLSGNLSQAHDQPNMEKIMGGNLASPNRVQPDCSEHGRSDY